MHINIVLFQPEIPQNTGNISRTCSVTGSTLHLVGPLGFSLDERHLRRAGLDYWDGLDIRRYPDTDAFFAQHGSRRIWYFSQKGLLGLWDDDALAPDFSDIEPQIWLAFGCESRGLDEKILLAHPETVVRIPMLEGMRSLNLSNAVAIAVYEVLRRTGGQGLLKTGRFPGRDNA